MFENTMIDVLCSVNTLIRPRTYLYIFARLYEGWLSSVEQPRF
jgi:hypothetical protein